MHKLKPVKRLTGTFGTHFVKKKNHSIVFFFFFYSELQSIAHKHIHTLKKKNLSFE